MTQRLALPKKDPLFIDVGRLRERIIIQQRSPDGTDSGTGLPAEVWTTFASRLAYFDHVSSQDMYQSPAITGVAQWKITLRYLAGVTSGMRVMYRDQVYEIQGEPVDVQMRRIKLEVYVALHDDGAA